MPLNRQTVDTTAGKHVQQLQELRHVSDKEKREIRKLHEQMARKVEVDKRK